MGLEVRAPNPLLYYTPHRLLSISSVRYHTVTRVLVIAAWPDCPFLSPQVAQAIDSSNDPRGYTHISEGLKVGLEVMDGVGKRAGARRVSEL